MKTLLCAAVVLGLMAAGAPAQNTSPKPSPRNSSQAELQPRRSDPEPDTADLEQLRADLRQLTNLLSQMRANLAFVQTTQTPLKHQFELEADAWQVMVERMKRRLDRMERNHPAKSGQ